MADGVKLDHGEIVCEKAMNSSAGALHEGRQEFMKKQPIDLQLLSQQEFAGKNRSVLSPD